MTIRLALQIGKVTEDYDMIGREMIRDVLIWMSMKTVSSEPFCHGTFFEQLIFPMSFSKCQIRGAQEKNNV